MAVSLKHNFNCAKADGVDATAVKPSDWNAEHVLTASAGKVLGTPTGSTTVSELPIEVDPAGASVKLPSGATASRPVSPSAGMTRYNTSTNRLEYYTNGAWKNVDNMTVSGSQPATAIAGDFWLDTASGNVLKQYTGTAWVTAMPDGSVTYAKLQNVNTSRVLGRKTAAAGVTEELTLSELLDFIGSAAQGDILYRSSSGWARLAAGTAGQILQTNGSGANPAWVTPSYAPDVILEDQKPQNTDGGAFNNAADRTRTLNTEVRDVLNICTLSANQFTLPAGTYYMEWSAPAYGVDNHQSMLYNVTAASIVKRGNAAYASNATSVQTESRGNTVVTVAGPTVFEIRHRCLTTRTSALGFGVAGNFGTEVYTSVNIWKMA